VGPVSPAEVVIDCLETGESLEDFARSHVHM